MSPGQRKCFWCLLVWHWLTSMSIAASVLNMRSWMRWSVICVLRMCISKRSPLIGYLKHYSCFSSRIPHCFGAVVFARNIPPHSPILIRMSNRFPQRTIEIFQANGSGYGYHGHPCCVSKRGCCTMRLLEIFQSRDPENIGQISKRTWESLLTDAWHATVSTCTN